MRRLRARIVVPALALGLTPVACKKKNKGPLPICLAEVAAGQAEESEYQELPPDIWFSFLIRNFDRQKLKLPPKARDCSNRPIEGALDKAKAKCVGKDDGAKLLPERPLTEDDLLVVPTEENKNLVWIAARHFDSGEAIGPVAVAEWIKRGVAVRAIGSLRAHSNRARLRLEPMGEGEVLVAESDVCDPDNPKKCWRVVRLIPVINSRFSEQPLLLEDGTCLGPVRFELFREHMVTLPTGWERKFELSRNVGFEEGAVVITEQVTIKDSDPSQPDNPPKVFRQANADRPLTLTEGGIVTTEGLWDDMVAEHGSVRPE